MGIFDKIKKMFVGNNTSDKTEEKIKSEIVSSENEEVELQKLETIPKKSIDEFFQEKEEYIFNNLILNNLFNDENKYSDGGLFAKTEKYLKKYFEDNGYNRDESSAKIQSLISASPKRKTIGKQQDIYYDYFRNNQISLNFEGHFSDWVKLIIDQSFILYKPLTKQYARILVGFYYYKTFCMRGTIDSLYKNMIAMISYDEFKKWIVNDSYCFDRLAKAVIKRFKKMDVQEIDERILLIQLIKSKLFEKALNEFEFLDEKSKKSAYASIYNYVLETNQSKSIDLNIKNVVVEEAETTNNIKKAGSDNTECTDKTEKKTSEKPVVNDNSDTEGIVSKEMAIKELIDVLNEIISNVEVQSQSVEHKTEIIENKSECHKKTTSKKTIVKTNELHVIKEETNDDNSEKQLLVKKTVKKFSEKKAIDNKVSLDIGFDQFLKTFGKTRNVIKNPTSVFLESIREDLEKIEKETFAEISISTGQSNDEEIDNLLYF